MDNLDHCFCMFQVKTATAATTTENESKVTTTEKTGLNTTSCSEGRGGAVRRVDLIVTSHKQFPFALLGWTGSKVRVAHTLKLICLTTGGIYNVQVQKISILPPREDFCFTSPVPKEIPV